MKQHDLDAIVVGAGFGGIYTLKKLRDMGLSVLAIDAASDVGGTWYWNRYPGAMSDTEAHIYRYSWDKEDLQEYPWKEHYVKQPDVLAYLNHVTKRYDLRKNMQFDTELTAAHWDDSEQKWVVQTSTDETFTARYIVTALGLLSKRNFPNIPGLDTFSGDMHHTGAWPKQYDFAGKRVGIIGCGSTGVQVITQLGKEDKVKSLLCFQRTPQYSVPSGDGPVSKEYREQINARYPEIWDQVRNSLVSFGFEESKVTCMSVSPEERRRIFQENWDKGNGFRFVYVSTSQPDLRVHCVPESATF
jgi:cyclohexanone monooxygenase